MFLISFLKMEGAISSIESIMNKSSLSMELNFKYMSLLSAGEQICIKPHRDGVGSVTSAIYTEKHNTVFFIPTYKKKQSWEKQSLRRIQPLLEHTFLFCLEVKDMFPCHFSKFDGKVVKPVRSRELVWPQGLQSKWGETKEETFSSIWGLRRTHCNIDGFLSGNCL